MSDQAIALGVLVALLGLIGTSIGIFVAARQKGLSDLVTALQRELSETRDEVKEAVTRVEKLERRDRAWADYVHKLRSHIVRQLPPPPPEWPEGLDV